MLSIPSRYTCVWTIVSHVSGRVKSPTLLKYARVMSFISIEQIYSLKIPFVEE